ncbi:TetR/AcrR family transcriptional regulator [Pseudonocardia nematodicida]|uniref:TetR/AcrR family transcriptional regulator n=1 Tax=Pseudonocardia nematodicida TaxID=1206997 RepID=A0ABV1KH52_9PSEU
MVTSPSARGEYTKSVERRREIIAAAVEVFSVAGFHKGSLRDVAKRAGLTQAGVLHHFPSKNHLVKAVLTWRDEQAREAIGDAARVGGLTYIRAMVGLVDANQRETPELAELYAVLSAEATSHSHPAHDYFAERYAWVLDAVQTAFEDVAEAGHLRPGVDPPDAARWMLAMVDGLQIQWLYSRKSVDMTVELRRFLQTLLTVDL